MDKLKSEKLKHLKKYKIIKIDNFEYTIEDNQTKRFVINLDFYDLDYQLQPGDYLYFSINLLDENYLEYSHLYTFGQPTSKYGRSLKEQNTIENDLLVIETEKTTFYLKRYYG